MLLDPETKKHTLRLLHHNTAIVSAGMGDETVGATVTWFTQSSFDPPLVTLAIKADSTLYSRIQKSEHLVISLVARGDLATAGVFFKPRSWEGNRFGGLDATPHATGGAILAASPAWLVGKILQIVERGDHHLVLTEVVDAGIHDKEQKAMCLSETNWHYGG